VGACSSTLRHLKEGYYVQDRSETSRSVQKPKGLTNLGHSCYVNCILQLLHASPVPAIFLNEGVTHLLDTPAPSTKLKMLKQLV
jgi:ubiquitin C-terminal hydrolase